MVVLTSADSNESQNLYEYFIKPAVKKEKIAPNPKELAALKKLAAELERPQAKPVLALPEIADQVSGKTYQLEKNSFGVTALRFNFKDPNEASLTLDSPCGKADVPVGLDELYRFFKAGQLPTGYKGRWLENLQVFEMDWLDLGEPLKYQGLFTFEENTVRISVTVKPTNRIETILGKAIVE